jgi:hypothetical protein
MASCQTTGSRLLTLVSDSRVTDRQRAASCRRVVAAMREAAAVDLKPDDEYAVQYVQWADGLENLARRLENQSAGSGSAS